MIGISLKTLGTKPSKDNSRNITKKNVLEAIRKTNKDGKSGEGLVKLFGPKLNRLADILDTLQRKGLIKNIDGRYFDSEVVDAEFLTTPN